MPNIPMPDGPGMIRSANAPVHMTGAPGMNFLTDKADVTRRAGRLLQEAGSQFGGTLNRAIDVRRKFLQQEQDTEDELSAAEAKNYWNKINGELTNRMAENPGSYKDFPKWAQDTDKEFEEGVKPFLDRMSPEFKKKFVLSMQGIRAQAFNQRVHTGIQAKISDDYNRFQTLFKDLAVSDPDAASVLLEKVRSSQLISENEFKTKKEIDLPRVQQSAEVRRLVEMDSPGIIDDLKKMDAAGKYIHFTHLSPDHRQAMIRYASARDSERRANENTILLDQLQSGNSVTREDIEKAFEGKNSPEDLVQKQQQIQMVDRFHSTRQRASTAAKQEQYDKKLNAMEYSILVYDFPADPAEAQKQYSDMKRKIFAEYAGDGSAVKRLIRQLDDKFDEVKAPQAPRTNYKHTYIYGRAQRMLNKMKKDFYSRYPGREDKWYINTYNDSRELKDDNFMMAKVALDHFLRDNPSAKESDVEIFLQQLKKDVNYAECDKLVEFWASRTTPQKKSGGEIERIVNGRIAVFGPDKKFKRWKDGK